MSVRPHFPATDTPQQTPRGGAPVGALQELGPIELAAVVYLRAWCAGGADRGMIARDFGLVMGDAAAPMVADFDALMTAVLTNARRPVMRHGLGCTCFCGDESAFANLVAAAAGQDHEEALLFASTLVKGHAAWAAVELALRLGQVFLRLARMPSNAPVPTHNHQSSLYKN
jgi:hypothetical protein